MEVVITICVVLGIFIMIILIVKRKWKNATLDKLALFPGEKVLFDDEGVEVELKASPRIDILPGSVIRVTNCRIVIAQKALGRSNARILKYVIDYTGAPQPEGFSGSALETGYISYRTIKQKMSIIEEMGTPLIHIEPLEDGMGIPVWLHIKTDDIEKYRNALGIV